MSLVETALVCILVNASELTHDGKPDLGVERDLVSDGDTLEQRGKLHWTLPAKEAGVDLTNPLRGSHRVHPDVVQRGPSGYVTERIEHNQNSEP